MSKAPLLGLCPIGKSVFSHEDALRYKAITESKLREWGVEFVNIDEAIPDGMVRSQDHVEPVVRYLKRKEIDALFIPHCNFGTEGAAAVIARDLGVPVLLWGPRDEAPLADGTRLRDSLCGLFATSKVLRKLGVTFTYIENCSPDDDAFRDGVTRFIAVANVVRKARRMRIGQIGQRIDFFWTTIANESELLERFGVVLLPLDIVEFIARVRRLAESNRESYAAEIAQRRNDLTWEGFDSTDAAVNVLAVRDALLDVAREKNLDAFAVQSFMSICEALGCMIEYSCAAVADAGIPVACETDIHGAISSVLLQAASMDKEPIFFADLTIRHPENDDAVLLWHCSCPESMRDPRSPVALGPHWILPGIPPGSCHWEMKPGPLTVFRFDGDRGDYCAISGQGHTVTGPMTLNTYAWMEVSDWPAWEQAFINGPYIHHVACCYGHHSNVLREAARYVPGLSYQQLP